MTHTIKRDLFLLSATIISSFSIVGCGESSTTTPVKETTYETVKLNLSLFDTYLNLDVSDFGVGTSSKNSKYIFENASVRIYVDLIYNGDVVNSKTVKGDLSSYGYVFWSLDGQLLTGESLKADVANLTGTVKWATN